MTQDDIDLLITQASQALVDYRTSSPKVGAPMPIFIKDAAITLLKAGMTRHQVAARLGVSHHSVDSWSKARAKARPLKKIIRHDSVAVYPVKSEGTENGMKLSLTLSLWKWLALDVSIGSVARDPS